MDLQTLITLFDSRNGLRLVIGFERYVVVLVQILYIHACVLHSIKASRGDVCVRVDRGCACDLPPNMMEPALLQQIKLLAANEKKNTRRKPKVFLGRPALFLKKSTRKELAANHFRGKRTGSKSFSTLMFGAFKRVRC